MSLWIHWKWFYSLVISKSIEINVNKRHRILNWNLNNLKSEATPNFRKWIFLLWPHATTWIIRNKSHKISSQFFFPSKINGKTFHSSHWTKVWIYESNISRSFLGQLTSTLWINWKNETSFSNKWIDWKHLKFYIWYAHFINLTALEIFYWS